MDALKLKPLKKVNILILGANGYIGKAINDVLIKNTLFNITAHVRKPSSDLSLINCAYNSDEFIELIKKNEIIILCSGIGLSKLYRTKESNFSIIKTILGKMQDSGSNSKLIYLSTMKAYNPKKYKDIYSQDKQKSESLINDNSFVDNFCIVRLPAVLGENDPNLKPMHFLAKLNLLRLVDANSLPAINFIGIKTLAHKIMDLIEAEKFNDARTHYILNANKMTWNDLASCFNKSKKKKDLFISMKAIKIIWNILCITNLFSFSRCLFPEERFYDFFVRQWDVQTDTNIHTHYVNQSLSSAISEK